MVHTDYLHHDTGDLVRVTLLKCTRTLVFLHVPQLCCAVLWPRNQHWTCGAHNELNIKHTARWASWTLTQWKWSLKQTLHFICKVHIQSHLINEHIPSQSITVIGSRWAFSRGHILYTPFSQCIDNIHTFMYTSFHRHIGGCSGPLRNIFGLYCALVVGENGLVSSDQLGSFNWPKASQFFLRHSSCLVKQ